MSNYTKVVTEKGVYKTKQGLERTKKLIEGAEGLIKLPPYGDNKAGYINPEKVTIIRKG